MAAVCGSGAAAAAAASARGSSCAHTARTGGASSSARCFFAAGSRGRGPVGAALAAQGPALRPVRVSAAASEAAETGSSPASGARSQGRAPLRSDAACSGGAGPASEAAETPSPRAGARAPARRPAGLQARAARARVATGVLSSAVDPLFASELANVGDGPALVGLFSVAVSLLASAGIGGARFVRTAGVRVCNGPSCRARGSEAILTRMQNRTATNCNVLVKCGDCMGRCAAGPNVAIQPPVGHRGRAEIYAAVDARLADRIFDRAAEQTNLKELLRAGLGLADGGLQGVDPQAAAAEAGGAQLAHVLANPAASPPPNNGGV